MDWEQEEFDAYEDDDLSPQMTLTVLAALAILGGVGWALALLFIL